MDGIHESYHTRLGRHDDRVRPRAAAEIPDPVEGLARGDPRRGEEYVGAPDQVVQQKLSLRVYEPVLFELLDLRALGRPHPGLHLSAETFHYRRCEDALGGPSDTDDRVQVGPPHSHGDGRCEISFWSDLDTRSCLSDLLYEALVPVPVEDGDGDLRRLAAERPSYGLYVLRNGGVDVDIALRSRAHDQLAHVHIRGP